MGRHRKSKKAHLRTRQEGAGTRQWRTLLASMLVIYCMTLPGFDQGDERAAMPLAGSAAQSSLSFASFEKDVHAFSMRAYASSSPGAKALVRAMSHVRAFMEATKREIDFLCATVLELDAAHAITKEELLDFFDRELWLNALVEDRLLLTGMSGHPGGDEDIVAGPLMHNKLRFAMFGARHLASTHFGELIEGRIPAEYSLDFTGPLPNLGPSPTSSAGNPKATYLATALLAIVNIAVSKQKNTQLSFGEMNDYLPLDLAWPSSSALAYVVPVPDGLQSILMQSAFRGPDANTMVILHHGFGYGMPIYAPGADSKAPLPFVASMDCASFVSAAIEAPRLSTSDLKAFEKFKAMKEGATFAEDEAEQLLAWASGDSGRFVLSRLSRVTAAPHLGDIYWHDGHLALLLGMRPDGELITVECNRDIETRGFEGYGYARRQFVKGLVRFYRLN